MAGLAGLPQTASVECTFVNLIQHFLNAPPASLGVQSVLRQIYPHPANLLSGFFVFGELI